MGNKIKETYLPRFLFPAHYWLKNTKIKEDKFLSKLSNKIMMLSMFDDSDGSPLTKEDGIILQDAIEVYSQWLIAMKLTHKDKGNNYKESMSLLGFEKSKRTEIEQRDLRFMYLCKTDHINKTSKEDRILAVHELTNELNFLSVETTISALWRASLKGGGMQELKLPRKSDF